MAKEGQQVVFLDWVFAVFLVLKAMENRQWTRREANQSSGHNFHRMAIRPGT